MHRLRTALDRRRDEGAVAVEYGLIVTLIAAAVVAALVLLAPTLGKAFGSVAQFAPGSGNHAAPTGPHAELAGLDAMHITSKAATCSLPTELTVTVTAAQGPLEVRYHVQDRETTYVESEVLRPRGDSATFTIGSPTVPSTSMYPNITGIAAGPVDIVIDDASGSCSFDEHSQTVSADEYLQAVAFWESEFVASGEGDPSWEPSSSWQPDSAVVATCHATGGNPQYVARGQGVVYLAVYVDGQRVASTSGRSMAAIAANGDHTVTLYASSSNASTRLGSIEMDCPFMQSVPAVLPG